MVRKAGAEGYAKDNTERDADSNIVHCYAEPCPDGNSERQAHPHIVLVFHSFILPASVGIVAAVQF